MARREVECSLNPMKRLELYRKVRLGLLFAVIYAAADIALNRFGFSDGWTILWPLNGITISILLGRRRSDWAPIMAGVALGAGFGECLDNNTVGMEVWLRAFSVTEVVLSALLLPAFTTLDEWLRKPRIFLRFAAALVIGPGVSGLMAAALFHFVQHQRFLPAFNGWATADALGIAAMMPLALSLRSTEMQELFRGRALLRTLGILGFAFAVLTLSLSVSGYPLLFLVYPMLLLVDLTLSFSGSAIVFAGLCFYAILVTVHGAGRFGMWPANLAIPRGVALQIFLSFHVLALFPASILIRDRRRLIDDLNSSNTQLLMLASLDGLTGLSNRRSLDEEFIREWRRATRQQTSLAMIMLDVDQFKQFNDLYGHRAGDDCLRATAMILRDHAHRAEDHVARFGGEEFVLLLPHTDLAGAQHIAEEIRQAIYNLRIPHAGSPWEFVTMSLGCAALVPSREESGSDLLGLADAALYQAKHAGRNCVQSRLPMTASVLAGKHESLASEDE